MSTAIPENHAELEAHAAAAATGGSVVRANRKHARGIVSDTRAIKGGEAFVALRGDNYDAHAFLAEAASRGAALLVIDGERILPDGPDVVKVSDTLVAWGDLARAHLRAWRASRQDARTIAITGSAGKTTTKQLCAALLSAASADGVWASPGNLNNLVGVPAVIFALERTHRFAVIEIGMSVRGEIARLASIASADVAVITNVALAHAEGVGGSRQDVAREKGALFDALDESGTCVFDADDELCRELANRSRAKNKIGFGRSEDARYRLIDRISRGPAGSRVIVRRSSEDLALDLPLLGEAAAIDLCAALAAVEACTGPLASETIASALAVARNVDGRAAVRDLGDILVIDDTYNANPASMRAAFSILADLSKDGRRAVAVLGEMKELGPTSRAEHSALGDALAASRVALVIGCGGLASETVVRARALGIEGVDCESVDEAAAITLERIRENDVVLVKGSRSVGAEKIVAALGARR